MVEHKERLLEHESSKLGLDFSMMCKPVFGRHTKDGRRTPKGFGTSSFSDTRGIAGQLHKPVALGGATSRQVRVPGKMYKIVEFVAPFWPRSYRGEQCK